MKSLNHWVFSAPSHAKFLRQYTKYSLADILVLRERKILQAFCGLESSDLRRPFRGQHAIPQVVHKVQLFGYGVLHPRKSHPNLLRIWDEVIHRRFNNYLKKTNPQNAWRIFRSLSTKISARLYFVYYLRNGVLSSEISPKIRGFHF